MKLFDKIKNVLFEEEEIEVPVTRMEEKKAEDKTSSIRREERRDVGPSITEIKEKPPVIKEIPKKEAPVIKKIEIEDEIDSDFIERDIFNPKKTFEFPVFDESDFEDTKNFTRGKNNILEKEKETQKKVSFGKYDEIKVDEKKEDVAKNFKPSPVISPVYGILDQNYKKEDIKAKDFKSSDIKKRALTVESVRNKAYGTLEDEIESILPNKILSEKALEDLIKEEDEMEITSPKKTIDDLLLDAVDESLTVGELEGMLEDESLESYESKEEHMSKTMDVLDGIESEIEEKTIKESIENDTLENDLFNLIDSMYDTREEE